MKVKSGFTLTELLVVITTIALLIFLFTPALAELRKSAADAECMMNLNRWGTIFKMYTADNYGFFTDGEYYDERLPSLGRHMRGGDWLTTLWDDYIAPDPNILLCPMAASVERETPIAFRCWGGGRPNNEDMERYIPKKPDARGSYTLNNWVNNVSLAGNQGPYDRKLFWRNVQVANSSEIPIFTDSTRWAFYPKTADTPPPYEGNMGGAVANEMRRICINRHDGAVNILMMDFSARRVSLKKLWEPTMRWHRKWFEEASESGQPQWPDWMKDF
jgi:prepilin-type processing-associated H-X9-DG protein